MDRDDAANEKLLVIDILNFSSKFGFTNKVWYLDDCDNKIKTFIEACKNSNYKIRIHIDASIQTEEAMEKWKSRRETEVNREQKDVPMCLSTIIGDMFRENGITDVYYSRSHDNDDTIAYYAHHGKGSILSNDMDFFRYVVVKPKPNGFGDTNYFVYGDFDVVKEVGMDGRHILKLHSKSVNPKKLSDMINKAGKDEKTGLSLWYRNIINKDSQVICDLRNPGYQQIFMPKDNKIDDKLDDSSVCVHKLRRGTITSLMKYSDDIFEKLSPMRAALYFYLGLRRGVCETWPSWNKDTKSVEWKAQINIPRKENIFDLEYFKIAIYRIYNSRVYIDKNIEFDPILGSVEANIPAYEYINHNLAVIFSIVEIYATAMPEHSFLELCRMTNEFNTLQQRAKELYDNMEIKVCPQECYNWNKDGTCKFGNKCLAKGGHFTCKCRRGPSKDNNEKSNCRYYHSKD